ncbi:MAG: DUF502 domain-containing protein [Thermodesulfobacteriota bacterium]
MPKQFFRPFFKGLGVVIPFVFVVYMVYWVLFGLEAVLKDLLTAVLPQGTYLPGLGIAIVFIGVFLVGLLMYPWITRKVIQAIEAVFRKLPVVGSVYASIHDVLDLFDGGIKQKLGQPVLVDFPQNDFKTLGFLMREDTTGLPEPMREEGSVVVYLQMSYQVGGYALIIPRDRIHPIDMSVEKALQWVLTAGLSFSETHTPSEEN